MHTKIIKHLIKSKFIGLILIMRPKQWIKNAFVLAPLFFSGEYRNFSAVSDALITTLLFIIASSATYIMNDINDVERDKLHPKKSLSRPLASGQINVQNALVLLLILCTILVWSWFNKPSVAVVIFAYLALNFAYTFALKHQPVIDIFCIAIGFVLRVLAGSMALTLPISDWMLITTLCLALFLAAVKRRQELVQNGTKSRRVLDNYSIALIERFAEMSATGAIIFYGMFVMTVKPQLVVTIPFVLFGLFRYWYVVDANEYGESPTDALMSDWQLLLCIGLWVLSCSWKL